MFLHGADASEHDDGHIHDTPMSVNATGTLGGSQVERSRRENRGAVGGEVVINILISFYTVNIMFYIVYFLIVQT